MFTNNDNNCNNNKNGENIKCRSLSSPNIVNQHFQLIYMLFQMQKSWEPQTLFIYFCTLVVAKCTNHRDDQIRNYKHQLCNHFNSSVFVVERRIITAFQNTNNFFPLGIKKKKNSNSTFINTRRLQWQQWFWSVYIKAGNIYIYNYIYLYIFSKEQYFFAQVVTLKSLSCTWSEQKLQGQPYTY